MSEFGSLTLGLTTLVVGVQDDAETGCLRMYLGHRSRGLYALVEDADAKEKLRGAWGGSRHLVVNTPPADVIFSEDERP